MSCLCKSPKNFLAKSQQHTEAHTSHTAHVDVALLKSLNRTQNTSEVYKTLQVTFQWRWPRCNGFDSVERPLSRWPWSSHVDPARATRAQSQAFRWVGAFTWEAVNELKLKAYALNNTPQCWVNGGTPLNDWDRLSCEQTEDNM